MVVKVNFNDEVWPCIVFVVDTDAFCTLSVGAFGRVNLKRNRATAVAFDVVSELDIKVVKVPRVKTLRSVTDAINAFR